MSYLLNSIWKHNNKDTEISDEQDFILVTNDFMTAGAYGYSMLKGLSILIDGTLLKLLLLIILERNSIFQMVKNQQFIHNKTIKKLLLSQVELQRLESNL